MTGTAAKRLAESVGLTTVTFYDMVSHEHVLTMEQAQAVIIAVAVYYQTKLAKKQNLMVDIQNTTTEAELEVITW